MRLKVLQIAKYYFPYIGGIEKVSKDIASVLNNNNIDQKIICFNDNAVYNDFETKRKEDKVDIIDGIEVYRCSCFTKLFSQSLSLSYNKTLKKLLNEFLPDIVILHYPNPFASFLMLKILDNKTKLITFWHLDITKQRLLGKLFSKQTLKIVNRSDIIVSASPNYIDGSKYLSKAKHKCIVIPDCIHDDIRVIDQGVLDKANEIRKKYINKFICFTVGRHVEYKGYKYLIEAARYLDDDYVFLIGGVGPLTNKLKKQAKNTKNIHFLGCLSNNDLKAYYLACDAITFSSITRNEAFGISLAEGMFYEKPAITFTIPGSGVNYVNLNGVTGIECDNKNVKEYAESIKKLKEDKLLKTKLGENAKKRVMDLFTFHSFSSQLINMIMYIGKK